MRDRLISARIEHATLPHFLTAPLTFGAAFPAALAVVLAGAFAGPPLGRFFCAWLAACVDLAPLPTTEEALDAVADAGLPSLGGGCRRRRSQSSFVSVKEVLRQRISYFKSLGGWEKDLTGLGCTLLAAVVDTFGTAFFAACGFCFALCAACILNSCVRCHFNSFIFSSGICHIMGCLCAFSCFLSLCCSNCCPSGDAMYCSINFCFSLASRGVEDRNCSGLADSAYSARAFWPSARD